MAEKSQHTVSIQQSKTQRGRGRPQGSTDHPEDRRLLVNAARLVTTGRAKSATAAFAVLAKDDEAAIRRLQRKWKKSGSEYLGLDRKLWNSRWEFEVEHLRKSLPTLYARVVRFAASQPGKARLEAYPDELGEPAHPMSLGIMLLFEIMEEEERKAGKKPSPRLYPEESIDNPSFDERRFDRAIAGWVDGGFEISSKSLRELARKCTELAEAIDVETVNSDTGGEQ